jgi:hypothetical protein
MEKTAGELKTYDSDQTVMKKTKNDRKRATQFGATVSAKSLLFDIKRHKKLEKTSISICVWQRLSKTRRLKKRAKVKDVRNGISCCCRWCKNASSQNMV